MADNFNVTEGTGTAIRAVEKSSKKHQVVVLDLGGAGAESLLTTSIPIQDGGNTITVDGTVAVTSAGITTLAGAVAGTEMQADIVAALPAGTNLLGKVGIDQSTANANEVVVKSGTIATLGATNGAAVITDADGTIQQYLRGLVALSLVDNAVFDNMLTALQVIDNMISGSEAQVDVASITAGETHIGAVGGNATMVDVTPTISSTAANAAGDFVGTDDDAITIAGCGRVNAGTGKITSAVLIDKDLQSIAMELWLFDTEPTIAVHSNAAWSIADAEAIKCIGVIPFATYYASALNSVAPVPNLSIPFKCGAGATALYGALVTRGAPTYAADGLTIRLFVDQD